MILIDTGPLVALHDPQDQNASRCKAALIRLPREKFATTWPCIAEAIYFLGKSGGIAKQNAVWQSWRDGRVEICDLGLAEIELTAKLMQQYDDLPMDLADATLVALADFRGWLQVFTLDAHFFAYRLPNGRALDTILPT